MSRKKDGVVTVLVVEHTIEGTDPDAVHDFAHQIKQRASALRRLPKFARVACQTNTEDISHDP